jgi:hypothetical protein
MPEFASLCKVFPLKQPLAPPSCPRLLNSPFKVNPQTGWDSDQFLSDPLEAPVWLRPLLLLPLCLLLPLLLLLLPLLCLHPPPPRLPAYN